MQIHSFETLVQFIHDKAYQKQQFVIAISGFGGAGKTTLTNKIAETLKDTQIIHLDDFIIDQLSTRSSHWDGFDWERLQNEILIPLKKQSKEIEYGVYDWKQNKIVRKQTIQQSKYVIVEGVGLIRNQLAEYFDCTIWIDTPFETALERGKHRDEFEYGVDHNTLWNTLWGPNDKDYFEKYLPKKMADICFLEVK